MWSSKAAVASSLIAGLHFSRAFHVPPPLALSHRHQARRSNPRPLLSLHVEKENPSSSLDDASASRRDFFATMLASSALATTLASATLPAPARAAEGGATSTADAAVTDKIFIEFKGLSAPGDGATDRITIGLFGRDAPQPVSVLKQVVTAAGYKSKCRPLDDTRVLQKEQLEANKVYNSCIENEDSVGVNYEYATVWRVVKDERIDVGAVSGKFIARENPLFVDGDRNSGLVHDQAGVISVRRGDEAGYGFTIFPGGPAAVALDQDNIVVGRVLEGMDVVARLNALPVVKSAGLTFAGGPKAKNAPSRGCRYGGNELYCNEDKPLKKVLLDKTGVL